MLRLRSKLAFGLSSSNPAANKEQIGGSDAYIDTSNGAYQNEDCPLQMLGDTLTDIPEKRIDREKVIQRILKGNPEITPDHLDSLINLLYRYNNSTDAILEALEEIYS